MGFRRHIQPLRTPSGAELTSSMAGIGMRFAAQPNPTANIEDTLLFASEVGMVGDDLRVLAMLTS